MTVDWESKLPLAAAAETAVAAAAAATRDRQFGDKRNFLAISAL